MLGPEDENPAPFRCIDLPVNTKVKSRAREKVALGGGILYRNWALSLRTLLVFGIFRALSTPAQSNTRWTWTNYHTKSRHPAKMCSRNRRSSHDLSSGAGFSSSGASNSPPPQRGVGSRDTPGNRLSGRKIVRAGSSNFPGLQKVGASGSVATTVRQDHNTKPKPTILVY